MKLKMKTTRQLSIGVGVLSCFGLIALGLGPVWGFEGLGQQISISIGVIGNAVNVVFLGVTGQKNAESDGK